jgi:DNA repair exonuclease SbcCD ATPase subunit
MSTTTEPVSLLTIAGLEVAIPSATQEAIARRDALLARARRGTSIAGLASAEAAGAILKEIDAFIKLIESTRTTVKAPVLELGKRVDAVAAEVVNGLKAEKDRIGGLIAEFQQEQARKEQDARRKAFEEQERIRKEAEEREAKVRQEAEEKARVAREAEEKAQREAAELEAKASRARSAERQAELQKEADERRKASEAAAAKAEEERKAAQEKADRERAEAQKAIAAQNTAVSLAAAPKLTGLSVRGEIKFEVTDIQALFAALPGMVLLTPNNAAIKAQLKTLPEGQSLPGVRHWKEAKTSVR